MCGRWNGRSKPNFCPNCGAKMKGGVLCDFAEGIIAKTKAEAYKEAFEKVKEELKNIAKIDWQGGYYYLVGEAFFDNILNELVGE